MNNSGKVFWTLFPIVLFFLGFFALWRAKNHKSKWLKSESNCSSISCLNFLPIHKKMDRFLFLFKVKEFILQDYLGN